MKLSVLSIPSWDFLTESVSCSSLKKEEIRVYLLHSPDCPVPDCHDNFLPHVQAHLLTQKLLSSLEGTYRRSDPARKGPHGKPFLPNQ